jgi:hypothetical protein
MGPFIPAVIRSASGTVPSTEEEPVAGAQLSCSECYNAHARANDAQVKAAKSAGKVPMTKQGTCVKCGKATIVVCYDA